MILARQPFNIQSAHLKSRILDFGHTPNPATLEATEGIEKSPISPNPKVQDILPPNESYKPPAQKPVVIPVEPIAVTEELTLKLATQLRAQLFAAAKAVEKQCEAHKLSKADLPISLSIACRGGEVDAASIVVETLERLKADGFTVKTYSDLAQSGAAVIAAAGSPGHRYVTQEGRFTLHQPRFNVSQGTVATVEVLKDYLKTLQKNIPSIFGTLVNNSQGKLTEETLKKKTQGTRDWTLYAKEAIQYGLADKIGSLPWNIPVPAIPVSATDSSPAAVAG